MAFYLARKLAASVLGQDPNDAAAGQELKNAGVPVSEASCRACADPCDEGHEEFPKRFDVDMETEMRGSVKPYRRQVLISTGKADWAREVTDVKDSLANHISSAENRHKGSVKLKASKYADASSSPASPQDEKDKNDKTKPKEDGQPTGVLTYKSSGRLSVLNGSHTSNADDPETQATVLVLPDYVAVSNVPLSAAGADAFWEHALDPSVPRAGTVATSKGDELKTWTLPYNFLIMLCSHKKRDARCHIAAQRLEEDFAHTLESEGWLVDTDLEDLSASGPPLESIASTDEEREASALAQLQALGTNAADAADATSTSTSTSTSPVRPPSSSSSEPVESKTSNGNATAVQKKQKKALILKNSHIGGHKFAGNVIIYFPQGSSIWYGRVTPHHVPSIVHHTLLAGQVLPQLLRGGLGIVRPGCTSLLDW